MGTVQEYAVRGGVIKRESKAMTARNNSRNNEENTNQKVKKKTTYDKNVDGIPPEEWVPQKDTTSSNKANY